MASANKVIIMGNLTRDPELRYLPSGVALTDFTLAVNRKYKSQDGQVQEEVTFLGVEAWGKRGETIHKHLSKGSPIYVEGRLKLEKWQDREGKNRQKLKVVLENFQFLGQGGGSGQGAKTRQNSGGGGYETRGGNDQGGDGSFWSDHQEKYEEEQIPF